MKHIEKYNPENDNLFEMALSPDVIAERTSSYLGHYYDIFQNNDNNYILSKDLKFNGVARKFKLGGHLEFIEYINGIFFGKLLLRYKLKVPDKFPSESLLKSYYEQFRVLYGFAPGQRTDSASYQKAYLKRKKEEDPEWYEEVKRKHRERRLKKKEEDPVQFNKDRLALNKKNKDKREKDNYKVNLKNRIDSIKKDPDWYTNRMIEGLEALRDTLPKDFKKMVTYMLYGIEDDI